METPESKKPIDKCEKFPVAVLEAMATSIYTGKYRERETLREILEERKRKLNKKFVFTPEHIEKFLWIDREIKKCAQILQEKGVKITKELEKMVSEKDAFFNDFEVEAIISPVIVEWSDEYQCESETEDKIIEVIEELGKSFILKFKPSETLPNCCYFGDLNWNDMLGAGSTIFADHHIGYGMHDLCDHSLWSFFDIVRITDFWCDIKVLYQHF